MRQCRKCKVNLTDENWPSSAQKERQYICKACHAKTTRKWEETHPEYIKNWRKTHPKYMTEYMKGYRQKNRERIQEIARLEQHRRERELSTDTILNKWFEGAHLHHMTPSTAVYIPEELHRSVYHNLKTGVGMKEINTKATDWLQKLI
jgi:hypothetical protein